MILLLIGCHAQSHQLAFGEDRAGAESELAKLKERLGHDRWGKNGKGDEPTHTIACPTGDVVVVLEKVEVARLIDDEKDAAIHLPANERTLDQQIARTLKYRRALAAEGFIDRADSAQ